MPCRTGLSPTSVLLYLHKNRTYVQTGNLTFKKTVTFSIYTKISISAVVSIYTNMGPLPLCSRISYLHKYCTRCVSVGMVVCIYTKNALPQKAPLSLAFLSTQLSHSTVLESVLRLVSTQILDLSLSLEVLSLCRYLVLKPFFCRLHHVMGAKVV